MEAEDFELSEDHVKILMYNMLCGMNFLHTAGIMHRDLKPANILVDENCIPILCDFGLARTTIKSKADSQLVSERLKESVEGRKNISERLGAKRDKYK